MRNATPWQASALSWLLPAVLVLSAGCVQSLLYYPDRILYDTPSRVGLKYEQVAFASRDGTRLAGWFVPATGHADPTYARGTVIHYHGNAQNLSAHWRFVEWLPERGFNVFVFDYRGYGASEGSPEPKGVFEDSDSALNYLRSRVDIDPGRLLVFGQSLGGANAIAVVGSGNRAGVKAIAVEGTFFSYSSVAGDRLFGVGALMDDTYSPDRYVARLTPLPFLLLHGTDDRVVPYAHAERLLARANEPKRLIAVQGGGHTEALTSRFGTRYREAVVEFFDAALSAR